MVFRILYHLATIVASLSSAACLSPHHAEDAADAAPAENEAELDCSAVIATFVQAALYAPVHGAAADDAVAPEECADAQSSTAVTLTRSAAERSVRPTAAASMVPQYMEGVAPPAPLSRCLWQARNSLSAWRASLWFSGAMAVLVQLGRAETFPQRPAAAFPGPVPAHACSLGRLGLEPLALPSHIASAADDPIASGYHRHPGCAPKEHRIGTSDPPSSSHLAEYRHTSGVDHHPTLKRSHNR